MGLALPMDNLLSWNVRLREPKGTKKQRAVLFVVEIRFQGRSSEVGVLKLRYT